MELELTDDQRLFHETSRKFLDATMATAAVRALAADPDGFDRAWWRSGAELGWTSLLVDGAHGGGAISGSGLADLAIVAEELGRHVAPGPLLAVNVVANAVSRLGSADQQAAVLPGLLDGSQLATWCVRDHGRKWTGPSASTATAPTGPRRAEAQTKSEPAAVASARGVGFEINAKKVMVEAGAQADWLLVTAATAAGPTQFLLPSTTAGIEITPSTSVDLVRRYATVRFNGVQVGLDAVLGTVGHAAQDIERQLQVALVLQCAEMTGAAGKVFEFTCEYATDRYSFGRPLASYQALKHRFADMKTWLEASYATTLAAAAAVHAQGPDAPRLASVAKAYVADRTPEIIHDCIQMHGGIGVTWEHDLHLYLRRVTLMRAMYGTPDEHRERIATIVIEREDAADGNR